MNKTTPIRRVRTALIVILTLGLSLTGCVRPRRWQRLVERAEEVAQAVQRQQHQVVQAQARQGLQLGT